MTGVRRRTQATGGPPADPKPLSSLLDREEELYRPERLLATPAQPFAPEEALELEADVMVLYPSTILAMLPGLLQWLSFLAAGGEAVRVLTAVLAPPQTLARDDADEIRRDLEANQTTINDEDALATERVQRGVRSRHADPGPLGSVEAALAHFQRYLAQRLLPTG